jgi:hypothetical protein
LLSTILSNHEQARENVMLISVGDGVDMDALNRLVMDLGKMLPNLVTPNIGFASNAEYDAYHAALETARQVEVDRVLATLSPIFKPQKTFATAAQTSGLLSQAVATGLAFIPVIGSYAAIAWQFAGAPIVNKVLGVKGAAAKPSMEPKKLFSMMFMGDSFGISNRTKMAILLAAAAVVIALSGVIASVSAAAGSIVGFVTFMKAFGSILGITFGIVMKASLVARLADFSLGAYHYRQNRFAGAATTPAVPALISPTVAGLLPAPEKPAIAPPPPVEDTYTRVPDGWFTKFARPFAYVARKAKYATPVIAALLLIGIFAGDATCAQHAPSLINSTLNITQQLAQHTTFWDHFGTMHAAVGMGLSSAVLLSA